jgi:hypothetical protein
MGLDRRADIAQPRAGAGLLDADHQALIGHVDQAARLERHVTHQIHAAGIAVPAIEQRRHVDIDDVAVLERLVRGMPWHTTWLIEMQQEWA